MPTLLATYNAYSTFEIPDDVFLLTVEENAGAENMTVGSWWIKWNTLHYIDANGDEKKIDGSDPDVDAKRPEGVEETE